MRAIAVLLGAVLFALPVGAASGVTVSQLEQFLLSKKTMKLSDAEIAEQLSEVALSEELTAATMARILSEARVGPRTAEQLELLGASSVFNAPPSVELPHDPKPDVDAQRKIIESGRAYVNGTLRQLPDFLAVRVTRSFNNSVVDRKPKHGKPRAPMHFVQEYRREIGYRSGKEVDEANTRGSADQAEVAGLTTWGEFGGMLKVVLDDAFGGNVEWERWQRNDAGAQMAVFRYVIPRASSHYSVDFCCYQESKENPVSLSFHAKPGYHGEIFVDPTSGAVGRITLEAELKSDDPVKVSEISVEYGRVNIGGKAYICPIRGVAVSEVHNLSMESIDGVGQEKATNLVQFAGYRKFGSTARILTGIPEDKPE